MPPSRTRVKVKARVKANVEGPCTKGKVWDPKLGRCVCPKGSFETSDGSCALIQVVGGVLRAQLYKGGDCQGSLLKLGLTEEIRTALVKMLREG